MAGPKVKVRGIYATALTALLLRHGFTIVAATPLARQRFHLPLLEEPEEASLFDRRDKQGVIIEGVQSAVEAVVEALRRDLPHAPLYPLRSPGRGEGSPFGGLLDLLWRRWTAEFPGDVKDRLDALRATVVPTLPGHHRLKVIEPRQVDEAEQALASDPGQAEALVAALRRDLLSPYYRAGHPVTVRHRKPGQGTYEMHGTLREVPPEGPLVVERTFRAGGTYDTLDAPKKEGDYGLVEFLEGGWVTRRRYFRADGTPLGDIYNLNTPVELYPSGPLYIDLEVDVVHWPGGRVEVVDREVLARRVEEGHIPPALGESAWALAQRLREGLERGEPPLALLRLAPRP